MQDEYVVPRLHCHAPPGPNVPFTLGNSYEILASYSCEGCDVVTVLDDEEEHQTLDVTGWMVRAYFDVLGDYKEVWEGEYE